jgi:hypothetical protein
MKDPCPASLSGWCLARTHGFIDACRSRNECDYEPDSDPQDSAASVDLDPTTLGADHADA